MSFILSICYMDIYSHQLFSYYFTEIKLFPYQINLILILVSKHYAFAFIIFVKTLKQFYKSNYKFCSSRFLFNTFVWMTTRGLSKPLSLWDVNQVLMYLLTFFFLFTWSLSKVNIEMCQTNQRLIIS